MILREPGLRTVLSRLPGRKVVFSNSPLSYAQAVLRVLRVADLFDGIFSIEHTGFRPKPDPVGFLRLLRRHGLHPRGCVMVEDSLENLVTARRLGMKTVWVTGRGRAPDYVDVTIRSIRHLPAAAAALR
jgi:putative hydrolase of the HAD superfamily